MSLLPARVNLVTLGVSDLARSTRFYEALGWTRSGASSEGITFLRTGGSVVALFSRRALAHDAAVDEKGDGFRGVALAVNVPERMQVDEALAHAERAGAQVTKRAEDAFWGGRSGYFADPDGHLWEVAWNPHFPLGPDGLIQLPE